MAEAMQGGQRPAGAARSSFDKRIYDRSKKFLPQVNSAPHTPRGLFRPGWSTTSSMGQGRQSLRSGQSQFASSDARSSLSAGADSARQPLSAREPSTAALLTSEASKEPEMPSSAFAANVYRRARGMSISLDGGSPVNKISKVADKRKSMALKKLGTMIGPGAELLATGDIGLQAVSESDGFQTGGSSPSNRSQEEAIPVRASSRKVSRQDSLMAGAYTPSRKASRQETSLSASSLLDDLEVKKRVKRLSTERLDEIPFGSNRASNSDFDVSGLLLVEEPARMGAPRRGSSKQVPDEKDGLAGSRRMSSQEQLLENLDFSATQGAGESVDSPRAKEEEEVVKEESADWMKIFHKMKCAGEVHKDDLPKALEFCGFMKPRTDWVHEVFVGITTFAGLEQDEFITFVQNYREVQHKAFAAAFDAEDVNGTGLLEVSGLQRLINNLGVYPMSHVLEEVIAEVEDGNGLIDLREFEHIADILFLREGFSKAEYEEFKNIYERFDYEQSGEIETKELACVLNWLGFAWGAQRTLRILNEVDVDGSGTINLREYLMSLRLVREAELKAVEDNRVEFAEGGPKYVHKSQVPDILRMLGYDPWDRAVIQEAEVQANLTGQHYDLFQLWRLMTVYRKTEGFCSVDIKEMDQAFMSTQNNDEAGLHALEASKALRELGFVASFEVVQSILCKVDVDDSGDLDRSEFRKMVRMLQERETTQYREAYMEEVSKNVSMLVDLSKLGERGELGVGRAKEAMTNLGFLVNPQYLPQAEDPAAAEPTLSQDAFVSICGLHARDLRKVYKRNGGWTDAEVKHYKDIFERYLPARTNRPGEASGLTSKELVKLVEDLFPQLAKDRSLRPQLSEMMKQVTVDPHGSLVFKEFLKLMKLFREWEENERVAKEWSAIKNTGFTQQEVQEFRDLFIHGGDAEGEISFEKFRAMIHAITPLGDALTAELEVIFFEMVSKRKTTARVNDHADFPEFLFLMQQLLDNNFAHIKDKTSEGKEAKEEE